MLSGKDGRRETRHQYWTIAHRYTRADIADALIEKAAIFALLTEIPLESSGKAQNEVRRFCSEFDRARKHRGPFWIIQTFRGGQFQNTEATSPLHLLLPLKNSILIIRLLHHAPIYTTPTPD